MQLRISIKEKDVMVKGRQKHNELVVRSITAVLLFLLFLVVNHQGGILFLSVLGMLFIVAVYELVLLTLFNLGVTLIAIIMLLLGFLSVAYIRLEAGSMIMLWMVSCVIVIDISAYTYGRLLGKKKILPKISPNKTWWGLWGAVINLSLYHNIIMSLSLFAEYHLYYFPLCIIVAVLMTLLSQSGDFLESWLKRRANKKDSGNILPGHGGILDRIDGMILLFPILLLIFKFIGL